MRVVHLRKYENTTSKLYEQIDEFRFRHRQMLLKIKWQYLSVAYLGG